VADDGDVLAGERRAAGGQADSGCIEARSPGGRTTAVMIKKTFVLYIERS
jgi:hypothetical protein